LFKAVYVQMEVAMKSEIDSKKSKNMFLLFGILQTLGLGIFFFLVFRGLNIINGSPVIGLDSQIMLSVLVPIFIINVEYVIFSKL